MSRFEADIEPKTGFPRVRFNFDNGWSASIVLRMSGRLTRCLQASLAACPTGEWGTGQTELGETEASPEEVVAFLRAIADRPEGWRPA